MYDGVFSVDTLPSMPRLLVCNTDPSYMPGRHWICIYVVNISILSVDDESRFSNAI